jgi:hypothetical protein
MHRAMEKGVEAPEPTWSPALLPKTAGMFSTVVHDAGR